jgi:predicted MFS family arabinose efflux permease
VTRGLRLLFAIAAGAAVGNLYYVQPLLDVIGQDLGASHRAAGLLVTATQVGYALGILLIVPLGDLRDRRRLVTVMMALSAMALLVCGLAPDVVTLTVALGALGVTTVSGQILIPLAGDLSDDASRGRTVGVVVSGVITGILVSRTVSGFLADALGWRLVFFFAAVATLILAALLRPVIPRLRPKTSGSYLRLLRSVFSLVATERTLQVTMVFGATAMAIFTLFWTALTFLLSGAPYHYSPSVIGLFGVVGLVGSLAAQGAGRLHDRGWSVAGTGVAWGLAVLAWVVAGAGRDVLVLIVVAVVVLDVGVQGQNLLSQSRIFALSAEARSRLNTAFVCGNFVGGALGSVAASLLWSAAGWRAVSTAGALLALFGVVLWLGTRRSALRPQSVVEASPTG